MHVARSCYYAYCQRKVTGAPHTPRTEQAKQVKECFDANRRRYGSRRIAAALKIGRHRVRSVMRAEGLRAIQPRSFKPRTTDSRHDARISPNLLKDVTSIDAAEAVPGAMLVGDITYLPVRGGRFCYLATFQDKVTRRIIGWEVAAQMTRELVVRALQMALRRGLVGAGAIVHTDRGSQYVSDAYRQLLAAHGLRQSMSARGNCYDNAQAESFFSRFKAELVEEGYYNRIRLHSSLGYQSPMEFERELRIKHERSSESLVS